MAFVTYTPLRPSANTLQKSNELPTCRRRPTGIQPMRFTGQPAFVMSANSEEEISVPISSLANMKKESDAVQSEQGDVFAEPAGNEEEEEGTDDRSEAQKEIDRLRAAEKFISVDEGNYECVACGYVYEPKKGERQSNIPPGTDFENLPASFICPVCRSPKSSFVSKKKIIAGFADNQNYGFGSNSLTGGQKNALIFGGLAFFFFLLLSGYALN